MQITHIPFGETERFKDVLFECVKIRKEVFIDEQSVPLSIEQDGKDQESSHLLLQVGNIYIATLRMRETSKGIKLERIAVVKKYRAMGYGKILVTHAIEKIKALDMSSSIYVHSQENATFLYSSIGFVPTGEKTIEANIPHITMVYNK